MSRGACCRSTPALRGRASGSGLELSDRGLHEANCKRVADATQRDEPWHGHGRVELERQTGPAAALEPPGRIERRTARRPARHVSQLDQAGPAYPNREQQIEVPGDWSIR